MEDLNDKWSAVVRLARSNQILSLFETRRTLSSSTPDLPGIQIFSTEVESGTPGNGIAVFVHSTLADRTRVWKRPSTYQGLWMRFHKSIFHTERDVVMGNVYINPISSDRGGTHIEDIYSALRTDVQEALSEGLIVMFGGDLNAKLTELSEFEQGFNDILYRFPNLAKKRYLQKKPGQRNPPPPNLSGTQLISSAVSFSQPLICTTGRGRGDFGQFSCRNASRTEHLVTHPDLYSMLKNTKFHSGVHMSDHVPVIYTFSTVDQFPREGLHGSSHTCDATCDFKARHHSILTWDPSKKEAYALRLKQLFAAPGPFDELLASDDPEGAAVIMNDIIFKAAGDAGMSKKWFCPFRPRKGSKKPEWFDKACRVSKLALVNALRTEGSHAYSERVREHKRLLKRTKRSYLKEKISCIVQQLQSRDPQAFKQLKKKPGKITTPVSPANWHGYLRNHFSPNTPSTANVSDDNRSNTGAHPANSTQVPTRATLWQRSANTVVEPLPVNLPRDPFAQSRVAPNFDNISLNSMQASLKEHISHITTGSASGFDRIPPEFIKYASITHPASQGSRSFEEHTLLPALSKLFHSIFTTKKTPTSWKAARISPLHKKGNVSDPNCYRMLAVNSVLYRLFANLIREYITAWAVHENAIPSTQFGFYPGRNTTHPLFILRHLSHHSAFRKPNRTSRFYCAFMDFTQAYDTVERNALWSHLSRIGMPATLISSVKSMYDRDYYILVDGPNQIDPVFPTHGVKQGCPLSPLLFSLFINDFSINNNLGMELGNGTKISHLFYADDLCLLTTNPAHMDEMLQKLQQYSDRKGLKVNAKKSCVMAFHGDLRPPDQTFKYGDAVLQVVPEFKYLGLLFNNRGDMRHADAHMSRNFWGAINQVADLTHKHGVSKRIDLSLLLYRIYAMPSALYGSQIWSTPFLSSHDIFTSQVQKQHLKYLKHLLHVRQGTPNWAILKECGQKPFQFFWWRSVVKFWNNIVAIKDNPLLQGTVKADVELAMAGCKECWSGEVLDGFKSFLPPNDPSTNYLRNCLQNFGPIDFAKVERVILNSYNNFWETLHSVEDYRTPVVADRKVVSYAKCCTDPKEDAFARPAKYLSGPYRVTINVARFRLGSHFLAVETDRWLFPPRPWQDRVCRRCDYSDTPGFKCDDEFHMIFECDYFHNARNHVSDIVSNSTSVFDFLQNVDFESTCLFISSCMTYLDELWSHSQATIPG